MNHWTTDDVKSVQSLVRSSDWLTLRLCCFTYIYVLFTNNRQKTNGHKGKKVNAMNLLQNSQYSWNIFFFRRSIRVLLELVHRTTQNFTIIDEEKHKIDKFSFGRSGGGGESYFPYISLKWNSNNVLTTFKAISKGLASGFVYWSCALLQKP